MELNDSTQVKPEPTRSVLGIDLNEVPSFSSSDTPSPDAFAVVRNFHDEVDLPSGAPAELPEDSFGSSCAACGRPELEGRVVVCDGCEHGFHIRCAGMRGEEEAEGLDEWRCEVCVSSGVQSSRWRLGSKATRKRKRSGVRLLDMNALPTTPSDGEGEISEESPDSRKHTPGDNSSGNPFGIPATYSNLLHRGNGFSCNGATGIVTQIAKLDVEDTLHHNWTMDNCFDGSKLHSISAGQRSNISASVQSRIQELSEKHLYALRQYVVERHGELEDGWHVEFKQFKNNSEAQVVYCAPDGRMFVSMPEVAFHLGLITDSTLKEPDVSSRVSAIPRCKTRLLKRRKSVGLSGDLDVTECMGNSRRSFINEQSSDKKTAGHVAKSGKSESMSSKPREYIDSESQNFNDGCPVQFEDFHILSLGKIDTRLSYHNVNQIWPIGFKSCWHDKITGSLFFCDVCDGGDSGPIFKVQRISCSTFPIPNGLTVLFRKMAGQAVMHEDSCGDVTSMTVNNDDNFNILTIFSEPLPPTEVDVLSCLDQSSYQTFNSQLSNGSPLKDNYLYERSQINPPDTSTMGDEIGEFSVEESSSSLAWRRVSDKIVEACRELHVQKGTHRFFCQHVAGGMLSTCSDILYEDNKKFVSLVKFSNSLAYDKISSVMGSDQCFESLLEELSKWLNQDRFGLDVEFVQEIIEQLPGVGVCSEYVSLNERSSPSSCVTVKNGLLMVKTHDGFHGKAEGSSFKGSEGSKGQIAQGPMADNHFLPPGRPISSKLHPWVVGDAIQVWEMLCQFEEVLDLKDSLSFEKLEHEILNPWLDNINLKNIKKTSEEIHGIISHKNDITSDSILSPCTESASAASTENMHEFIQLDTDKRKQAAQDRTPSVTSNIYTGVVLTKVHSSLLNVLMSELQSKVLSVVDPNSGGGEPKSKRGRKKDTDGLTAGKKYMQTILPFNELTWPELARRYILAILAMDGDLESADVIIREGGKVFRCLQGDGGVLCGSLTGVSGIEADALLLAEATRKIFGSLKRENDTLVMDDAGPEESSCVRVAENEGILPDWAQVLEPVKKLPTNVGARIRKCVYDALQKDPPEWAKKMLEHSISKAVYKGNASGPTKRAVLAVLSRVCSEGLQPKPCMESKKKKFVCISDLIMKQCRNVLRQAAAADDEKVFCNLLGRKLIHCGDNDDEGILGSPSSISRSLDFRTIDLRLAAGVYAGSHEAFLEDVRELWTDIRVAFEDEPDMVHLADTLSSNFELLYQEQVVTLHQKLEGYRKSDCLSEDEKKEIDHLLVSVNEVPKAPWEEGVCKVCGIDRDDDSVLLCDTCDAEYHTYCLIPPLVRIPEGNWYCPSCVAGKNIVHDASECSSSVCQRQKKNQGEGRSVYLNRLSNLAAALVEREYWELNVEERTYLLKFLCDELLNSALIRQYLERCAEAATDLQQKLRSLSAEWKSLKCKEALAAKAVKVDRRFMRSVGDGGREDVTTAEVTSNDKCSGPMHTLGDRKISSSIDGLPPTGDGQSSGICINQIVASQEGDKFFKPKESHSSLPHQDTNQCGGENIIQGVIDNEIGKEIVTVAPCEDLQAQGLCTSLDSKSSQFDEAVPLVEATRTSDYSKLNSFRDEFKLLQDSILSVEMELLKHSIRREFLGSDSFGRLYWILANSGAHPWVVVNENAELQCAKNISCHSSLDKNNLFKMDSVRALGRSRDAYYLESNDSHPICSSWVSYQSDSEIKGLLRYLKDNDQKERELKESILQFQKLLCQGSEKIENQNKEHDQVFLSKSIDGEDASTTYSLSTNATKFLENKYGPCIMLEATESWKKRDKRAKATNDKLCRCECLEPVWPSKFHCLSCHKSFFTDVEFEGHNDGKCSSVSLPSEKSKDCNDTMTGKGMMKNVLGEDTKAISTLDISNNGCSELNTRLIRFQNDGVPCPFDFENICSNFLIENSNKELVKEIGLIGTNGIPTFVSSFFPYLSHPASLLIPQEDANHAIAQTGWFKREEQLMLYGKETTGNFSGADNSPSKYAANESREGLKTVEPAFQSLELRRKKSPLFANNGINCCVVPMSTLRPLVGRASHILRQLKISLLDIEAVFPEEALRPLKAPMERRRAWRTFLKSAQTIYEMIQAIIVLEDMIRTEYLRHVRWYWSSLSAAVKISTLSSLALYIYSLDLAIDYEKIPSVLHSLESSSKDKRQVTLDPIERHRVTRKANKKRKELED